MRYDHVAPGRVNLHFADHRLRRFLRVAYRFFRKKTAHAVRMDIRHQPEIHLAVLVRKRNRLNMAVIYRRNINSAVLKKTPCIRQPFGRVVIATDDHRGSLALRQLNKQLIQQLHRFRIRICAVINIARDKHRIRPFIVNYR